MPNLKPDLDPRARDPANGVDGLVRDVCIADGRIVADVDGDRSIPVYAPAP